MSGWVIPFTIFVIVDAIVMVWVVIEDKNKNKFNHDLPNIEIENDTEEEVSSSEKSTN